MRRSARCNVTCVTALVAEREYISLIFDVTTCRAACCPVLQTPCSRGDWRRDVFLASHASRLPELLPNSYNRL